MPHINNSFLQAAANMEQAMANVLNAISGTATPAEIQKILALITKKEIILQFLLETVIENGNGVVECGCSGSVEIGIRETPITVNDMLSVGTVGFVGDICPSCSLEDSTLHFSFVDDDTMLNNTFTFISNSITPPTCFIDLADRIAILDFSGSGVVTRGDETINVFFAGRLQESTMPGGLGGFSINFSSQDVNNPFFANYNSPPLANSFITIENCLSNG